MSAADWCVLSPGGGWPPCGVWGHVSVWGGAEAATGHSTACIQVQSVLTLLSTCVFLSYCTLRRSVRSRSCSELRKCLKYTCFILLYCKVLCFRKFNIYFPAQRKYYLCRSLPNVGAWRWSHWCRRLVTWRWGCFSLILEWRLFGASVTCCCPLTVVVCTEASVHVGPQRAGTLCGDPESTQRGGGEAGVRDAEAGGRTASRSEHSTYWSRWGKIFLWHNYTYYIIINKYSSFASFWLVRYTCWAREKSQSYGWLHLDVQWSNFF